MKTTHVPMVAGLALLGSTPAITAQTGDPCALLTIGEVQQAFAAAKPGQLDRKLEKDGILRCVWSYPTGQV